MKQKTLRKLALASVATLLTNAAPAATFDDVQFWVGSGANRAAVVIDWNDGKSAESLLWGYRWDGAASGLDMLQAVVNADARLYAHFGNYSWGTATLGIGYDLNRSGMFDVSPSLAFDSGGLAIDTSPDDFRLATDSADHWLEGWNTGFWAYYLKASSGDAWTSALTGSAGRSLADGVWDGYSFAANFDGPAPAEPTPALVPEPSGLTLLAFSGVLLTCLRRSQQP